MNVVITGIAGFIGSHTAERLVARGHHVTGIDVFESLPYPAAAKRRNAADLERAGIRVLEGDIRDPDAVAAAITSDCDVVLHLAALAGVRPSLDEPQAYLATNIVGTGLVIERMRSLGKQKLVFASSSSVYGSRDEVAAFREDDDCLRPASPYAATKRMNELQLSTYRDLFGLGVFALRFFTVYGPRQRTDMAISKFIDAIANERSVTLFGDGESRRDYTYIDDIVSGVVSAVERIEPARYEILNLGGTSTVSLRDLVSIIERIVGKQARIDWKPNQPGDVPITFADVSRAREVLGYEPTTTVDVGIAKQWQWRQSQGA